jgi:hypothetical protein
LIPIVAAGGDPPEKFHRECELPHIPAPQIGVHSAHPPSLSINEVRTMRITACEFRHPITIDPLTSDAVRMSVNLGVVCLWTIAGLTLTAIALALGLGGEAGEFLAIAG